MESFNFYMATARLELAFTTIEGAAALGLNTRLCYRTALHNVALALKEANRMRDRERAGLCLKAMHWIRLALKATAVQS